MALKVYRNPKESVERMISRFNKKVQASRVLLEVKNRRYWKRAPTKRYLRQAAIMRWFYRDLREKQKFH